jgi:hypothetical protein
MECLTRHEGEGTRRQPHPDMQWRRLLIRLSHNIAERMGRFEKWMHHGLQIYDTEFDLGSPTRFGSKTGCRRGEVWFAAESGGVSDHRQFLVREQMAANLLYGGLLRLE